MTDSLSRRDFFRAVAGGAAGLTLAGLFGDRAVAAGKRKPNIILLMADDFGYECLGCNGSLSYRTPHLDRLAATGVRFEHCHANPLCTPSRVKIMTGRYNSRNYIRFGLLDPKETTFAHVLKKAGYATCIVGKWQLAGGVRGPNKAGFDEYCLWQISKNNRGRRYNNPTYTVNGTRHEKVKGRYGPDVYCDHLLDFVARNKDKPFFGYYPMCLTHSPFEPTPDSKKGAAKKQRRSGNRRFGDMVAYTDKLVGRIVAKLDELGLREDTLVLFTGDNGSPQGIPTQTKNGPVRGGKSQTLDTGTHVPLIANWKGTTPKGVVSDALVDFADVLPTFAEMAAVPLPKGVLIDGESLLPLLRGRPAKRRDWLFCHYAPKHGRKQGTKRWARDRRWKLYTGGALFDILADPKEKNPIAAGAGADAAAARKKLQAVLDRLK